MALFLFLSVPQGFWKVSSFENCLLVILIFGHSKFPRVEIQTGRVETKRITFFLMFLIQRCNFLDFLPFFFLSMYDDG